jgi:hypothetical protein
MAQSPTEANKDSATTSQAHLKKSPSSMRKLKRSTSSKKFLDPLDPRQSGGELDWIFYECWANDRRYSKTDAEKKFVVWEAKGAGIQIETVDDDTLDIVQTEHLALYRFFVVDATQNHVRFPFNSGDSQLGMSLSPSSIQPNLPVQNLTGVPAGNHIIIPRWSTASRSCFALVPLVDQPYLIEPKDELHDAQRQTYDFFGDMATKTNIEELSAWLDTDGDPDVLHRFFHKIEPEIVKFARPGHSYQSFTGPKIASRLYSIKTGVSYVGSISEGGGLNGKNLLESNSSLAIKRSRTILKTLKQLGTLQQREQQGLAMQYWVDPTFRLQVELMTITAPATIETKRTRDGFQVRDISASIEPNEHYLPAHAIPYTLNDFSPIGRTLGEIEEDFKFWRDNFAIACGRAKAKLLLMFGLMHTSANAQNFIMAFDKGWHREAKPCTTHWFYSP